MKLPDIVERCGCAWRAPPPSEKLLSALPSIGAEMCRWVFKAPEAHPLWEGYLLSLCHLRHIDGMSPPIKKFPEAEFEIVVYALSPAFPFPDTTSAGTFDPHVMRPANLVYQFAGVSDDQAITIVELLVRSFVAGYCNPDRDFRRHTFRSLNAVVEEYKGTHA